MQGRENRITGKTQLASLVFNETQILLTQLVNQIVPNATHAREENLTC